ncbi:class I SAM-dependent methyltransferase [Pontibacter silvestris]|uniref:Class I SAM-dependent methyltransferase n=1 Tax=Pontibacter silvestris TaxID=2305183 RepID=A0ABW4WVU6_9BACT|nr:class I SAM-dependent methyltransferase [Pontibacter silvestris]MCC9137345.1 class I SAM-dependent methyltransferase [Pontibacter silvestris]
MKNKIKAYIQDIKLKLSSINSLVDITYNNSVDIISAKQLSSLLNSLPYLPYTESSLRYSSITYFLNDIIINNRKVIVEFGSGISTIFLSELLLQLNLKDVTLISFDNNQEWLNIISKYIKKESLDLNNIHLIKAELSSCALSLNNNDWYNIEKLQVLERYKGKVDCVLVDGPEAWHKEIEQSRYPALPYVYNFLAEDFSLFLDDTDRDGEKSIIQMWSEKYSFNLEKLNNSFSRLYRGRTYNIK